jgi:hypothetical protein
MQGHSMRVSCPPRGRRASHRSSPFHLDLDRDYKEPGASTACPSIDGRPMAGLQREADIKG